MVTIIVLEHPDHVPPPNPFSPPAFPPFRLTLAGATLSTQVADLTPSTQTLPSAEAAKEHLERMLRLRRDEGYRIADRSEIEADEAEPASEPVRTLARLATDGPVHVDLNEDLISPEELAEAFPRIETWAPTYLKIERSERSPAGLLAEVFAGKVLPSVKSVSYTASCGWRHFQKPFDDLADLFAAFPNLERVDASGEFTLREAEHGALQELYLSGEPLSPETLAAIGAGSLPALTTLALELGKEHGVDRAAGAALRTLAAPRLRAVLLAEIEDVTVLLAELTEPPLPAPWTMLCVRGGVGDEDDLVALLRERAPLLGAVPMLGLPLSDELSEDGVAEVKVLLPQVIDVCDMPDLWGSHDGW
jgi:hypothetical protein